MLLQVIACDAGAVSAVISEERGTVTIDESIGIALHALADHSLTVRKTALQEIRNILHHHRAWLSNLLPASNGTVSNQGSSQQTNLLCTLLGALLKCCDPEVNFIKAHLDAMLLQRSPSILSERQCLLVVDALHACQLLGYTAFEQCV